MEPNTLNAGCHIDEADHSADADPTEMAIEHLKHVSNVAKCAELGWMCLPLVTDSFAVCGPKAIDL